MARAQGYLFSRALHTLAARSRSNHLCGVWEYGSWQRENFTKGIPHLPITDQVFSFIDNLPPALKKEALTPRKADSQVNYKKLELLGDAVLEYTITKILFATPEFSHLTVHERSTLVDTVKCRAGLSELGLALRLDQRINTEQVSQSMLEDVCEAIIGASEQYYGIEKTLDWLGTALRPILLRNMHVSQTIAKAVTLRNRNIAKIFGDTSLFRDYKKDRTSIKDAKTQLYELCKQREIVVSLVNVETEDAEYWQSEIWVQGRCVGEGAGLTKADADDEAAKGALTWLQAYHSA